MHVVPDPRQIKSKRLKIAERYCRTEYTRISVSRVNTSLICARNVEWAASQAGPSGPNVRNQHVRRIDYETTAKPR